MRKGLLFILSGPAGAGKGTLRKRLFEAMPDLAFSVSCTTRNRRPGETEGEDNYYISREKFDEMVASDEFLEWAEVHGNRYGTRLSDVKRVLDTGRDILLEIDVQGCRQVKAHWPDAIRIFITAPSLDELECRLVDRGTEDDDELGLRLRNAADEMRHASEYDRIIVNGDVDRASAELIGVMRKYRQGEIR